MTRGLDALRREASTPLDKNCLGLVMSASEATILRRVLPSGKTDEPEVPNESVLVDVVFVHGLGGDDQTTWAATHGGDSWLEWLASDVSNIAVWSLKYPAGATKWTTAGEGMSLPDRAANLIPTMLYYGIGSRKTVFVCHSLGGLVVKQILKYSSEMAIPEWTTLLESTLGVVFLATPHHGSNLASFAQAAKISRATKTLLALTADSPQLKELGDWYRQNAGVYSLDTIAFAEGRKIRRWIRLVMVVTATSADPGVVGCITTTLDADHNGISKPGCRDMDPYRGVEVFLRRQVVRAVANQQEEPTSSGECLTGEAGGFVGLLDRREPPLHLVRQVREVLSMGDMNLLDQVEVKELKMGILNRHYGVGNE